MSDVAVVARDQLLEALRSDQIACWHRGERRLVERFLADAPDLQSDADAVLDLIYNEVVVREELHEAPTLEEYLRRFPQFDGALRRQFTVHRLLETPSLRSEAATPAKQSIAATIPVVNGASMSN